ncbi:muellerian-inhibiting factor isoform X2 [Pseudoliparis swirei]|uniref:muellerian-inhibiting factor isoform X2 n=1 Tax=Pseudoliparis swirei TaxID=2059687 RepID=UPI0024BD8870|nr:muellerian-inhibiting factor isoform X2 [Pseudoliparis swirei]
MLRLDFFRCGALTLCCAGLCGALLIPALDPTETVFTFPSTEASSASTVAACVVDDVFTVLRDAVGRDGELLNGILSQFGICGASGSSSGSALLELSKETNGNQRHGLEALHSTGVLSAEEGERGTLTLTFDLPPSPLLALSPALLLAFETPPTGEIPDVTFTSQSLHPHAQTACILGGTRYVLLTAKAAEGNVHRGWRISVGTKSPDMSQSLKDILIGGKSGSNVSVVPLLLFFGERGPETRYPYSSPVTSSQTSFLCELKRFLGDVLPQDPRESSRLLRESLQSLPPLTLGLSSSDAMLAGLINSSSITIFSFSSWSSVSPVQRGELAFSPALLEELKQRLEQTAGTITTVIREERVGPRAAERLRRLRDLSAFPAEDPAAGESQYRAFLLLKALQTVARAYSVPRGPRATRAGQGPPARPNICGLKSLTVSLDQRLGLPNTVNINNCHGSCAFPMINGNNHAVLLNFHVEEANGEERAPCCVPVAYDTLEVVDLNEHGTYISIKPDMVAKECGCR